MEYQTTNGTALVTTESTSINYGSNTDYIQYWQWPYSYGRRAGDFPISVGTSSKPYSCTDDCHVFGCEHSTKCKCGKATRALEPKKCPCCGKRT